MIKKNKTIQIDTSNIFSNDKLQRESEIENLSNLVVTTKVALTISINADWGAGKTTFVKLWKEYLQEKHGVKSIYFSAWEDDFSKEPLISILGEINKYIEDNFKDENIITEKFELVKEFGTKVIKRGLPGFVKGVTSGILDIDKGFESAIDSMAEQVVKGLIENYSKDKQLTQKFKETIHNLLSFIDKDKPFVIFIDELDRCRPLYAIELLERIKHIFGIDGLIFVLSIDKKQLSESIKSQYGNIDTTSYLKRFIELEYYLKNTNKKDFCTYLYQHYNIDSIIKTKNIKNTYDHDLDHFAMLEYLVESLDLTLREIEQAFIQIDIVFKTMQPRLFESHFRVFIFFIILKIKKQSLYFGLINKTISHQEIIDSVLYRHNNDSKRDIETVIKSIIYSTSITNVELQQVVQQEAKKLEKISEKSSIQYSQQEWLLNLLKRSYGEWGDYMLNKLVDTAIEKIEFVDKFNFDGLNNE